MLARYEKDYLPFTRNGREYDFEEELMHLGMMKKAKERKEHDDFMTGLFGLAALSALKESLGGEEKETNRDDGDEHLRSPFPFDLTDCELSWDEDHLEPEEMDFEPEPQELAEFLKALFEEMEKEHEEKDDRDDKKDDDDRRSPVSLDDVSCLHGATTCCHGHDCDKETVPDRKSSIFGTEVEPVGAAMEFPVYCIFDHEKKTTTAFWSDGEKTVVTADAEDKYDPFLGVIETRFYLEGLDGNYVLDHTDSFRSRRRDWTTTDNDYYPIKGFTVRMSGDPSSPRIGSGVTTFDWRENIYGWNFYYSRNSYAIHFYDGENELTSKIFKYQADISGADFMPQPPTGREDYVFQGWYDNESLEGTAYSFEGKTMPAGDFPLYAKWTEPVYKVNFDLNGADLAAQADPDAYDVQQVKKGETVTRPADPVREGYTFAGWTRADSPFHFETGITADTTLKARWISNSRFTLTYDPGEGTGTQVTDSKLYADGASASLLDCPTGWKAPQEHYGFLCWNTEADGSGTFYYPSDQFVMPADDVTLYAQWALIRETSLTYVYNYEGAPDPTTVPLKTPNALYAIEENNPERTGYRFLGWTIDQAGNGTLYQKGDKIRVDTLDEETNKLYAQWEIEIKPPTGLATETIPFVWMLVLAGMTVVLELTERKKDR